MQSEELFCGIRQLSYDFDKRIGLLVMEDGNCCDMAGCIALFERVAPKVLQIQTFAGTVRDTIDDRSLGGWQAHLPSSSDFASAKKPVIRLSRGLTDRIVNEAELALIASDRGLYQHAGRIVSFARAPVKTAASLEFVPRIEERGEYALVEDLTAAAAFQRYDVRSKQWVLSDAPKWLAKTLKQRGPRLRLPELPRAFEEEVRRSWAAMEDPGHRSTSQFIETDQCVPQTGEGRG